MTATPSIDLPSWMAEQLSQASPDLLRNMIQTFAEALMSADADAVCGAGYGQRSTERTNTRNGGLLGAQSEAARPADLTHHSPPPPIANRLPAGGMPVKSGAQRNHRTPAQLRP
jgi:Transposase, Mutator family